MNLSELAQEPKLQKVTIDDTNLIDRYGEPIHFWVYDRVNMETFMKLANLEGKQELDKIVDVMKELILNEDGEPIMSDGKVLPNDIMIKAVEKTVSTLGNFVTQTSQT